MLVPVDNVIRFPEAARGSTTELDRPQTLVKARDLMAQKLCAALRSLLPRLEEELLARGDAAAGRLQRELYYGTRDVLHEKAQLLESCLASAWLKLCESRLQPADKAKASRAISEPTELQLLDFGAMDQELAVKAIASRLQSACDEDLFGAGHRLAFLCGQTESQGLIEDLIAQALDKALVDAGVVGMAQLELLHAMENYAVDLFGPTIHDLNLFLAGRGVLPKLRRSYSASTADKKQSNEKDTENTTESADLFALLQKLVAPPSTDGGGTAVALPMPATQSGGPAAGVSPQGGTPGQMAVAMEQVMAALHTLQGAVPAPSADILMPNVLRDFRASDTGQSLDYLQAVTVDIIATLFDFIFDDASVADPIKVLVGRLQIPVLKVAMLDRTFFSSKAHPARRLLDGISRAAVRCGPQAGHDDPLYARIAEIVERLQNEFTQDTSLFDLLCVELDAFLEGQETAADDRAVQAAPLVAEQEQRELAALAADQVLANWLATPLPSAVTDLLNHEWRKLLIRHHLSGDDIAWGVAMSTVGELVASVQPQPDVQSRKRLAARLPTLVRRICEGLDKLHVTDDRRLALTDQLFTLHAAVLRGAAPPAASTRPMVPAAAPVPAQIASEHIDCGETHLERVFLSPGTAPPRSERSDHAQSLVEGLQRGDWLEFANPESGPVRYRLSWISPQRGILLLTNPQSPRAMSVSPDALAVQIERGEATILAAEPMFDRAVNRALETLKAA
ncbi:MAG: hypothetical protein AW09_004509 [Candidatus Accumulibacter phosphatis]|uniref:Thymidine phosphorylase n=1 Tax=Candidatus Accumulibacter phosphatis TaxID=327160 RepID=A0A084Y6Q1_9PROT|nr:DUF1631 family protein [Accumulibacter sp.]KFB70395.1 MAG: hypothetical protein AW09_004509 [Candidatus Accumulibacter phosphatis]MBL8406967.1 DUF1631 family protein [Accumulibacter sp.]HRF12117.1 DUF1631 family protein [Candidatus Accumulibacter phosphatis]